MFSCHARDVTVTVVASERRRVQDVTPRLHVLGRRWAWTTHGPLGWGGFVAWVGSVEAWFPIGIDPVGLGHVL